MREILVAVLAAVGVAFSLSGVVGIIRMPDVYSRIQCSSKTVTMGALPMLTAIVVAEGPLSVYGSRALLVALLLLVANPVASHSLARAAYKTGVPMWHGAVVDQVAELVDDGSGGDGRAGCEGRAGAGSDGRRSGPRGRRP